MLRASEPRGQRQGNTAVQRGSSRLSAAPTGIRRLCKPRLVVAVGNYKQSEIRAMQTEQKWFSAPVVGMIHPSAILRKRPYGGYEFGIAVGALTKAVAEHLRSESLDEIAK
jgi:hypothetical protein